MKYQDKDVIVREGSEGNTFYIILKGEVIWYHTVCTNSYLNLIPVSVSIYIYMLPPSGPGDEKCERASEADS